MTTPTLPSLSHPRGETYAGQIRRHLLTLIKSLRVGDRLPRERELAERFGTSRLTVHKVMASLQREGVIARRRGSGSFVACAEGVVRRDFGNPAAECLLVCYPQWFSLDIWTKVSLAAEFSIKSGLEVFDYKLAINSRYEKLCEKARERRGVRGIILIPPGGKLTRADVRILDGAGVPVVALVQSEHAALSERVACVAKDQFTAGKLLIEHLLTRGHRRIGYVANEPPSEEMARFGAGMKSALIGADWSPRALIRNGGQEAWRSTMNAGYKFTRELVTRRPPTALIYDSIPGALGGLSALAFAGLSAPRDVSVVVNDEYGDYSLYAVPPLTVVRCDSRNWVRRAFDLITTRPFTRADSLMEVKLIERESVAQI